MLLAEPEVHRALAYLVALALEGYGPTPTELNAYAAKPDRRPARHTNWLTNLNTQMAIVFRSFEVEPQEQFSDHVVRMHWASVVEGRLAVTPLGRTFFRALEAQTLDPETVLDVVLEQGDPIAFARVISRLGSCGPGLLVDPYFRLDQLMPVFQATQITRVLTSDKAGVEALEALGLGVASLSSTRPFEVRAAGRELHDRYIIPDNDTVQFIGASLNGLGQTITAMGRVRDLSDALQTSYASIWEASRVIGVAKLVSEENEPHPVPAQRAKKAAKPARSTKRS